MSLILPELVHQYLKELVPCLAYYSIINNYFFSFYALLHKNVHSSTEQNPLIC